MRPGLIALRRFERHCVTAGRPMIPIIIETGKDMSDPGVAIARQMRGVRAVFHKPFDLRMLAQCVGQVLGQSEDNLQIQLDAPSTEMPNPMYILVVDDDEEVAEYVAAQLEEDGYMTHCNTDPTAGLDRCKHIQYDLIILDYVLGDIQCEEWLAKLYAAVPQKRRPPVLIMTGFGDVVVLEQFTRWPTVKSILSKPFEPDELLNEVRASIALGVIDSKYTVAAAF